MFELPQSCVLDLAIILTWRHGDEQTRAKLSRERDSEWYWATVHYVLRGDRLWGVTDLAIG